MTEKSGDKILVGIDGGDGHFFYYSMRDAQDKGSIIDFIQRRQHLNLGEVRKKLRPWIKGIYQPNPKIPMPKPIKDRAAAIAQLVKQKPVQNPYDFELGG